MAERNGVVHGQLLTDAESLAAEIDRISASIESGAVSSDTSSTIAEKPKRKRRTKAEIAKEERPKSIAPDAMAKLCLACSHVVAKRSGEQWIMSETESQAVGLALDAVAAKYLPEAIEYQEESALAILVVMYVLARVEIPARPAIKKSPESRPPLVIVP